MGVVEESAMAVTGMDTSAFVTAAVGTVTVLVMIILFVFRQSHTASVKVDDGKSDQRADDLTHPPAAAKKKASTHPRGKASGVDKAHQHRHHLCLNTLKGHVDSVTGLNFSADGRGLATACADRVVRVFKLQDISAKSFKFLRINMPIGVMPIDVAFGDGSSQLVVAGQNMDGAWLCLYGSGGAKAAAEAKEEGKLPAPEAKWEKKKVHDKKMIIKMSGAPMRHGNAKGGVVLATCSEGTDVKVWTAADGRCVGTVDTNQLRNHMATLSPDGRFLAVAAFTADVKIWEVCITKDGLIKELSKVMQLKGHKSAVTWLCFNHNSQKMVTASKDGTIKIWNINVRYAMDEDPKCIRTFPIPAREQQKETPHFDRLAISPDDKILAATIGSTLQWLDIETGEVIDTAENAHDGEVSCLEWASQPFNTEKGMSMILATGGPDRKVKLWAAPAVPSVVEERSRS